MSKFKAGDRVTGLGDGRTGTVVKHLGGEDYKVDRGDKVVSVAGHRLTLVPATKPVDKGSPAGREALREAAAQAEAPPPDTKYRVGERVGRLAVVRVTSDGSYNVRAEDGSTRMADEAELDAEAERALEEQERRAREGGADDPPDEADDRPDEEGDDADRQDDDDAAAAEVRADEEDEARRDDVRREEEAEDESTRQEGGAP